MTEKERLYRLFTLELLDAQDINGITVLRVPGGWVIDKTFIPYFSDIIREFAFSPLNKRITLRCPCEILISIPKSYKTEIPYKTEICGNKFEDFEKEDYQDGIYTCPNCHGKFKYKRTKSELKVHPDLVGEPTLVNFSGEK